MKSKFSIQNIVKGILVIIGFLFFSASNLGLIFDMPNFGKPNVFAKPVGIALFIIAILWHYLDLNYEIKALRSKIPNIIFGESKFIKITTEQVDYYGEKSLISFLASRKKIYLFCIDFFNKPIIPNGNEATGVQVLIEFYDKNIDRKTWYLGKWIIPEQDMGIKSGIRNIPCNRLTGERLGIAAVSHEGDDFFLLDSSIVDNRSDGIILDNANTHLLAGKYTVIVTISGENFPSISKVYEIQNLKDERLIFSEKKDGEKFLKEVENGKKRIAEIWSSYRP